MCSESGCWSKGLWYLKSHNFKTVLLKSFILLSFTYCNMFILSDISSAVVKSLYKPWHKTSSIMKTSLISSNRSQAFALCIAVSYFRAYFFIVFISFSFEWWFLLIYCQLGDCSILILSCIVLVNTFTLFLLIWRSRQQPVGLLLHKDWKQEETASVSQHLKTSLTCYMLYTTFGKKYITCTSVIQPPLRLKE